MVTLVCSLSDRLKAIFLTSHVCTEDKWRIPYKIMSSNKIANIILDNIVENLRRYHVLAVKIKKQLVSAISFA